MWTLTCALRPLSQRPIPTSECVLTSALQGTCGRAPCSPIINVSMHGALCGALHALSHETAALFMTVYPPLLPAQVHERLAQHAPPAQLLCAATRAGQPRGDLSLPPGASLTATQQALECSVQPLGTYQVPQLTAAWLRDEAGQHEQLLQRVAAALEAVSGLACGIAGGLAS